MTRSSRTQIKHKLFILERKWLCHPFFHYCYPKPGFPRRLTGSLLAFLLLAPLILILFRPATTEAAWYSDTWRFRKMLTVSSSKVPSTQTNFPMLVSITDTGLKSHAQGTGNDILFTSSDGSTKLSHEIETFATGSGTLVAWVKIPSLSSATDTKIYMYKIGKCIQKTTRCS